MSDLMLTEKPKEEMIGKINNSLHKKDLSIEGLASAIGKGCSFCPGVFINDKRNKDNFISASFITLDIDDSPIPLKEAIKDFKCTISYPTFSNDVHNKRYRFRLIIRLDEDLKSMDEYHTYAEILSNLLKEKTGVCVDTTCYQGERMFFGTNYEVRTTISDYDYEKKYLNSLETTRQNYTSAHLINSIQRSKDTNYSFTSLDKPIFNYLKEGKSDSDIVCKGRELRYQFITSTKEMIEWQDDEEIRYEPQHIHIFRQWSIDEDGKRHPRKYEIGEDRRMKLFKILCIKKQIKPTIEFDELLYNAIYERYIYFNNEDGKLNNNWILSIIPVILNNSYLYETHPDMPVIYLFSRPRGKAIKKS